MAPVPSLAPTLLSLRSIGGGSPWERAFPFLSAMPSPVQDRQNSKSAAPMMKTKTNQLGSTPKAFVALLLALELGLTSLPASAGGKNQNGGGGGGGGGTPKLATEARVTGYVTAIDYVNHTITIGASYYGFGILKVDANTRISFDNVNCTFEELAVGDWVEARYDYTTRTATKLSASGFPS